MSNSVLPVFRILLTKMTAFPYTVRVETQTTDIKFTKSFLAEGKVGHVES
jgi:hypothetical protein